MRKILLALALCAPAFSATVTQIRAVLVGSTSAMVEARVNAAYTVARTRVIETGGGGCTGGTGGFVQTYGIGFFPKTALGLSITALKPSTTYDVCVEVFDGAWSSGVGTTVTTTALDSDVTLPTVAAVTVPANNGPTVTIAVGNCDHATLGYQKALDDAAARLPSTGTVIELTEKCTGQYTMKKPSNVQSFATTAVRTSDSRVTLTSHGFSDGQEIRISSTSCPPGTLIFRVGNNCYKSPGGWRRGQRLYAKLVDTNNFQVTDSGGTVVVPGYVKALFDSTADTIMFDPNYQAIDAVNGFYNWALSSGFIFQVVADAGSTLPTGLSADTSYCTKAAVTSTDTLQPVQIGLWSGSCGAAINFTTNGTGTFTVVDQGSGTHYVAPAPSSTGQYVVTRSAVTSGVPVQGRIKSTTMLNGGFQRASRQRGAGPSIQAEAMATNHVFEKLEWDTADATPTAISNHAYCAFWETFNDVENIVVQQVRFKGPANRGNRLGCPTVFQWDGRNMIMRNSEFVNFHYYRPRITGLVPSVNSVTKLRLTAGSAYSGPAFFNTATTSGNGDLDISAGSASGNFVIYFDMSGVLRAIVPTGITAAWTVSGVTTGITTSGAPAMPVDGSGCYTGIIVATGTITSGQWATTAQGDYDSNGPCSLSPEGTQGIVAGNGPGPHLFENNFVDWSGLFLHFDDSGASNWLRGNSVVRKNHFFSPDFTITSTAGANGMSYGSRQPVESKGSDGLLYEGNFFDGCAQGGSNPWGACIADTPRAGGFSKNHTIKNNMVRRAQSFANLCAPVDSYPQNAPPCENVNISNNLAILQGYDYRNTGAGKGLLLGPTYAVGGVLKINSNTVYDPRGNVGGLINISLHPFYGLESKNNVYGRVGNGVSFLNESVSGTSGQTDRALLQLASTAGPGGTANYSMGGNIMVPSYNDSYLASPTGAVDRATVCTAMNGSYNAGTGACTGSDVISNFALGSSVADRWAWLAYTDTANLDFRLSGASPLIGAGVSGANVGVDFGALLDASGIVRSVTATGGVNQIALSYTAPDTSACYYTKDGTTYVSDGGGSVSRSLTMTSVTSGTYSNGEVLCYKPQPSTYYPTWMVNTFSATVTDAPGSITNSKFGTAKTRLGGGFRIK